MTRDFPEAANEPTIDSSHSVRGGSDASRRSRRRPRRGRGGLCSARSRGRGGSPSTCSQLCLAAGLLELERRSVCLGARCVRRGPLCPCGVGARSLGQARPRLDLESWPLAAVKLAVPRPSCAPWRRHQRTATSLLSRSYWARTAPAPERRSRGCGATRLSRDRGSSGTQKEPQIDSRQGSQRPRRR
jgi:hypothetical protein